MPFFYVIMFNARAENITLKREMSSQLNGGLFFMQKFILNNLASFSCGTGLLGKRTNETKFVLI